MLSLIPERSVFVCVVAMRMSGRSLRMWFRCGDISSRRQIWIAESLAGDDRAGYADVAVVTETVTN
jgi:hypothetical protein